MTKVHDMHTFNRFMIEQSTPMPLYNIMQYLIKPAKLVSKKINIAGLENILGDVGEVNVQGEEVKKMDVFANDEFIASLSQCTHCCAIISEENDDIVYTPHTEADYIVAMDPMDGSSNIDVNIPIGTIFSVFKRKSKGGKATLDDCLQPGTAQLAAGYILYGTSTLMVITTGNGVHAFTLDPYIDKFYLSETDMMTPETGKTYSLNEGNYIKFPDGVKKYLKYCQENDKASGRPYGSRYVGSMVADINRNMRRGGIFIYPNTAKDPNGKLRLLYECNPMAFIAEQSGAMATNGFTRILEIQPTSLHQRTPIFIGSTEMVKKANEMMAEFSAAPGN